MTQYLGTIRPGRTVYIPFDTFTGSTGASITMSGLAVTDIEIYKDGGTTQRTSDNGYTLLDTDGIDFDGITGIHGIKIDLSDNSDAGFYAAGSHYTVVISSITVDSQTVNFVAAHFRIGFDAAVLNTTIASVSSQTSMTLTTGPAEDDALNGMWAYVHDVASAVQQARVIIDDYVGSTKTVTFRTGATFTVAATDNISIMAPLELALNAIDSGQIAPNAIGSSELAATAANEIADAVLTRVNTEGFAADGSMPTLEQFIAFVHAALLERSVSGTTVTYKKLDGSTTAFTATLNDATNPTSITKAS